MKIASRGRAKYRPTQNYDRLKVKELLMKKIQEEQEKVSTLSSHTEFFPFDFRFDKLNVVSLFSGCGGLDLGLELSGLDAVFGKEKVDKLLKDRQDFFTHRKKSLFHTIYTNDIFKEANKSYRLNFPSTIAQYDCDISKVKDFPDCDIVLGGFPCPGFSEAGPRLIDDDRNFLYIHFIRSLIQTKPRFFVAENVKGLLTLGKGEVAKQIFQDFESAGYKVNYKLVNAKDYGVPQIRERVFIIGVRNDLDFNYEFPNPTHGDDHGLLNYITLRDAIYDLIDEPGEFF